MSSNNRLILIDLKGAGNSPKPRDSHYSVRDHADLIYKFILDHDLKNLTLVGNSFGGSLSLLLSIMLIKQQPGRLRAVIVIDPGAYKQFIPDYVKLIGIPVFGALAVYLTPARFMVKSILKKSYYDLRKITADQIAAYAAPLAAPGGKHALLETGKQIIPPDIDELTTRYKEINVPTLIIWGKAGQNHFAPGRRAFIPSYSEFYFEVDRSMRARAAGREAGRNGSPGFDFLRSL